MVAEYVLRTVFAHHHFSLLISFATPRPSRTCALLLLLCSLSLLLAHKKQEQESKQGEVVVVVVLCALAGAVVP